MEHLFGQIPPLYLWAYLVIGSATFCCLTLWLSCRADGFISWGTLAAAILLSPLFTIVAPMVVAMAAMFCAMWVVEKVFGWIKDIAPPLFRWLRPISQMLARLAAAIGRKLSVRAFSCTKLKS
jgi:hypothetical protein